MKPPRLRPGHFIPPTMPQIRFTAHGANSQLGSFSSGDRVRVSEAFARHLVEEARVAEYVDQPAPPADHQKRAKATPGARNGKGQKP